MWIKRDFEDFLLTFKDSRVQPVRILKGPRQVGKTSLLEHATKHTIIRFDDFQTRQRATENPRLFLDQFQGSLILDEATLVPDLFLELKRRVDEIKSEARKGIDTNKVTYWITGSNQTLLEQSVQESLAGRASYFDLNTLSVHEVARNRSGMFELSEMIIKGGWPELHANRDLDSVQFLNDLISTFIEKDIVAAAGIERKAAFLKMTGLLSGRVGQLINYSDLARNVGVETTTVQSWILRLQQNAVIRVLQPYFTNLNQRLIKSPKIYFEDTGMCSRLQGWTEFAPLYTSPQFGHLVENLVLNEFCRFFINRGMKPSIFFLRSKEKEEVDFLVELPNNRMIAVEVKVTPEAFSKKQIGLIEDSGLQLIDRWVVSPGNDNHSYGNCRVVPLLKVHDELSKLADKPSE
jgi:predicted AAA+ superfamily ATPase